MYLTQFSLATASACLLVLPISLLAQPINATATHCHPEETIQFSCQIGKKTVSLCTGDKLGSITSLTYRYGLIGKIENEFIARPDNVRRFHGFVAPANPNAEIRQVWFDRGGLRYLLAECRGGNCPQTGKLAVLRGSRILMNKDCAPPTAKRYDGFWGGLVSFGADDGPGRSATELLVIDQDDNHLQKLYPIPRGMTW